MRRWGRRSHAFGKFVAPAALGIVDARHAFEHDAVTVIRDEQLADGVCERHARVARDEVRLARELRG